MMTINNDPTIPTFKKKYDSIQYVNKESVSQIKASEVDIQNYKKQLINRLTTRYLEEDCNKEKEKELRVVKDDISK